MYNRMQLRAGKPNRRAGKSNASKFILCASTPIRDRVCQNVGEVCQQPKRQCNAGGAADGPEALGHLSPERLRDAGQCLGTQFEQV